MKLPLKDKWNNPKDNAQYDPGFVAYLGLIFNPLRPCIDIGANVGKVTRFLAMRTRENIIAFEPAPSTFQCLKENTGTISNVIAINKAVGHINGHFRFVGEGTVTAHLSDGKRGSTVGVDVVKLDEAIDPNMDIGLIKIDVEGSELSVLVGAEQTIRRTRPLLAIEVIDEHLRRERTSRVDIFNFLNKLGYSRAVNKYGMKEHPHQPTGACDTFFIPDKDWYAPNLKFGYDKIKTEAYVE